MRLVLVYTYELIAILNQTRMKLFKTIIIIISFIIISCKESSKGIKDKQLNDSITYENKNIKKSRDLGYNKDFNIGLLDLNIGDTIPQKIEGYKLIKSVKFVEEGHEEPIIKVLENDDEVFQLSFTYDNVNEKYTNIISEILIFSNKFKTNENIGVNSTIEDFITVYSKYSIWYTYISNNYVIENENKNIQFLLDEKYYVGKKELYERDMIKLKKEDFAKNSRIKAIRIF